MARENAQSVWENMTEAPLLPLRNVVVFPHMIIPLTVGREKTTKSLEEAVQKDRLIILVTQKEESIEDPGPNDVFDVGVGAEILRLLKMPDGTFSAVVEGICRVKIEEFLQTSPSYKVKFRYLPEVYQPSKSLEALMRMVVEQFENYARLSKRVSSEATVAIMNVDNPNQLADLIAANMVLSIKEKQEILEITDVYSRLEKIGEVLSKELEVLELAKKLEDRVKTSVEKSQKEYFLREQMKAIQQELGEKDEKLAEIEAYRAKMEKVNPPPAVREKVEEELSRLEKMPPMVAESTVVRTYLDWLLDLPWSLETPDKLDLKEAEKILEEDHYGLKEPKERILEFLAVRHLSGKVKSPILCFVGPPGVGKTSLAKSIARAMGRKFVRMSLGGVRDEAEIRGHRRTYVGALPGRIIQGMKNAGSKNPVFLLDEIDKLGTDFRGDPSAALLEALDPEQNHSFSDHYIEVPFDLSKVLFITTANVLHTIPPALLDRMEVISLPGYTELEKVKIAERFLIPKQLEANGLSPDDLKVNEGAILRIIREYTREAGVRNLEREISNICRKVARAKVENRDFSGVIVTSKTVPQYLDIPRFHYESAEKQDEVGVATGVGVSEYGGDIMPIEVALVKGKGELLLTGQLGDVMKEAARAAITYVRSRAKELGIDENFYRQMDIHIHVPAGAIPKEGPSAGIAMGTALVSALTGKPVRKDVAMTGEITLRGRVLPIGGVREKVLAAHRAGIKTMILPEANKKELEKLPPIVKRSMKFVLVNHMDEVLKEALLKKKN
ncbi:MAG: endopeptidase La [Caldiserica bacterium]|nr:endopeptidase La [Caldisericota bacterium]MDH7562625.1 endopeptidase La [Caldisericota bacterium]